MQPRASRVERDLGALNRIADELFTMVRKEFVTDSTVIVHLDRSDRLLQVRVQERDVANATLLCAQLLRRATDDLDEAEPRQLLGLVDFLDQLIPSLVAARSHDRRLGAELRAIHIEIGAIAMNLAVSADPGAPGFTER
jgi:hypothetical protein